MLINASYVPFQVKSPSSSVTEAVEVYSSALSNRRKIAEVVTTGLINAQAGIECSRGALYPQSSGCETLATSALSSVNTVAICTFDAVINGEMRTGCQSIVNSLSSFRRKAVATSLHARNGEYSRYRPSQTIAKRRRIFGEADRASTRFDPFENRRLGDALSVARQNTFTRDTSPADVKKPQSFYEMIFAAYDRYAPTDYENVTRLAQRHGSNLCFLPAQIPFAW